MCHRFSGATLAEPQDDRWPDASLLLLVGLALALGGGSARALPPLGRALMDSNLFLSRLKVS